MLLARIMVEKIQKGIKMKIIKKILKIVLIIAITFFLLLVAYSVYDLISKKEYNYKGFADKLEVGEKHMSCYLFPGYYMHTWTYDYTINDRKMYIVLYQHSILNILAKERFGVNIDIDVGYSDFDEIYINGSGDNKRLIWPESGE